MTTADSNFAARTVWILFGVFLATVALLLWLAWRGAIGRWGTPVLFADVGINFIGLLACAVHRQAASKSQLR